MVMQPLVFLKWSWDDTEGSSGGVGEPDGASLA